MLHLPQLYKYVSSEPSPWSGPRVLRLNPGPLSDPGSVISSLWATVSSLVICISLWGLPPDNAQYIVDGIIINIFPSLLGLGTGSDYKLAWGYFLGDGNVLRLDCSDDNTALWIYKNSLHCTLNEWILWHGTYFNKAVIKLTKVTTQCYSNLSPPSLRRDSSSFSSQESLEAPFELTSPWSWGLCYPKSEEIGGSRVMSRSTILGASQTWVQTRDSSYGHLGKS